MESPDGRAVLFFENQRLWEEWLTEHYDLKEGIWIKMAKKDSGIPSITRQEALDTALCFGWIDGQGRSFDGSYYLQKYTPRRRTSLWSKINIAKVESLISAGRMRPSGMTEVEAAQADGRWARAYDGSKTSTVPPDLQEALNRNQRAAAFFESLDRANRYAVIWRVVTSGKPELRASRIGKLVTMLEEGKTFH